MNNTAGNQPKSRAEREAEQRSQRRAEQAGIVTALKNVLATDEQLLGFARGRIAGGFRGKLNVGPEAFFAPVVNIGLTERRLVLQHVHTENGRPSEILPHFFPLSEIESLTFSDIETYGAEPACRLVVYMTNQRCCRLRLRGKLNFESAESIAEVYNSLTGGRRNGSTPTQRTCAQCERMLDQPYKFCPYCGQEQPAAAHSEPAEAPQEEAGIPLAAEPAMEAPGQVSPETTLATDAADSPFDFATPAAEALSDPAATMAAPAEPAIEWPEPSGATSVTESETQAHHEGASNADAAPEGETEAVANPIGEGEHAAGSAPEIEAHQPEAHQPEAHQPEAHQPEVNTAEAHQAEANTTDEENIRYHDDTLSQGEF